jgi:hypothetical protein
MSSKFRLWPAVASPRAHLMRFRLPAVLAVTALLAQGCAQTPSQLRVGSDPADASVRVPSTGYRPVLSGYVSQRPVGPKPWREQNDSVAPAREK